MLRLCSTTYAACFLASFLALTPDAYASRMSVLDMQSGADNGALRKNLSPSTAAAGSAAVHAPVAPTPTVTPSLEAAQAAAMPLRVVNREQFCARLRNTFAVYANQNGYDAVQTAMLANVATTSLLDEFRGGRASDFISAPALSALAKVEHKGPVDRYLPVSELIGHAMGLSGTIALALSTGELRFIPLTQRGTEIVVIARNTAALSPERARKVAEVARGANIRISVLWAGGSESEPDAMREARSLAWLAAQTGGSFANISGADRPCSDLL